MNSKARLLEHLTLDESDVYVVPRRDLPAANVMLPTFAKEVMRWPARLGPASRIYWAHPIGDPSLAALTSQEIEQLLGVLAAQVNVREESEQLIATGRVRPRAMTIAWRWSVRAITSFRRWRHMLDALTALPPAIISGIHFIELPGPLSVTFRWPARVDHLVRTLEERAYGVTLGVILPAKVWARATLDKAWRQFREAAPTAGTHVPLHCLMAPRWDGADRSALLHDLARDWGLQFDSSLVATAGSPGERPYYPSTAYVGQPFDQRAPAYLADADAIVQIPRTPALPLLQDDGLSIEDVFAERQADVQRRLATALNHVERAAYHARLEQDSSLVHDWHRHHVYNWAPPEPASLRLFECDAVLLAKHSNARVRERVDLLAAHPALLPGERFLELAFDAASALSKGALDAIRAEQTDAHHYLLDGGRPGMTADSAQLLGVLPAALGRTLEIGFGAALLARQIRSRATQYVGVELDVTQARSLLDIAASPLVADIHALPFSAAGFDTVIADNVLEHAAQPLAVLRELRRVVAKTGAVYALIPVDARDPAFQIRTHLWKADESSIRTAARLAGFGVRQLTLMRYSDLGVYGCFPASAGETCLTVLVPQEN